MALAGLAQTVEELVPEDQQLLRTICQILSRRDLSYRQAVQALMGAGALPPWWLDDRVDAWDAQTAMDKLIALVRFCPDQTLGEWLLEPAHGGGDPRVLLMRGSEASRELRRRLFSLTDMPDPPARARARAGAGEVKQDGEDDGVSLTLVTVRDRWRGGENNPYTVERLPDNKLLVAVRLRLTCLTMDTLTAAAGPGGSLRELLLACSDYQLRFPTAQSASFEVRRDLEDQWLCIALPGARGRKEQAGKRRRVAGGDAPVFVSWQAKPGDIGDPRLVEKHQFEVDTAAPLSEDEQASRLEHIRRAASDGEASIYNYVITCTRDGGRLFITMARRTARQELSARHANILIAASHPEHLVLMAGEMDMAWVRPMVNLRSGSMMLEIIQNNLDALLFNTHEPKAFEITDQPRRVLESPSVPLQRLFWKGLCQRLMGDLFGPHSTRFVEEAFNDVTNMTYDWFASRCDDYGDRMLQYATGEDCVARRDPEAFC